MALKESIPASVRQTYGQDDLSAQPAFAGGFINFGHWDGIRIDGPLTEADRVLSQQNMYRRVLDTFPRTRDRHALEVGCGLGRGSALALAEYEFASLTGMDIHPQQLDRAAQLNQRVLVERPGRLSFSIGAAEKMPFPDAAFDCVYSVEAAQHFRDLAAFAGETARVLRPGGRLVLATFFATDERPDAAGALADLLESFAIGLDVANPVGRLTGALAANGLIDVHARSIGSHVWRGLDRYLARIEVKDVWPRNFLRAFRGGLLDYYLVTADRPAHP